MLRGKGPGARLVQEVLAPYLAPPGVASQEIAATAAKDEQRAAVRVELQHRLHPSG